jgi:hypothetical protein
LKETGRIDAALEDSVSIGVDNKWDHEIPDDVGFDSVIYLKMFRQKVKAKVVEVIRNYQFEANSLITSKDKETSTNERQEREIT